MPIIETPAKRSAAARRNARAALEAHFPGQQIPEKLVEAFGYIQEELDWQEVHTWLETRLESHAWAEARSGPRFQPAQRTCLGPLCRGQVAFASTHAGNRLCERCRRIEDTPTDIAERLYGLQVLTLDGSSKARRAAGECEHFWGPPQVLIPAAK